MLEDKIADSQISYIWTAEIQLSKVWIQIMILILSQEKKIWKATSSSLNQKKAHEKN